MCFRVLVGWLHWHRVLVVIRQWHGYVRAVVVRQ